MRVHNRGQATDGLAPWVGEAGFIDGQGREHSLDGLFVVAIVSHEALHKVVKGNRLGVSVHFVRLLDLSDDVESLSKHHQSGRLPGGTKV